ncbi:5'/3'-nucleotidase SurE [Pseudomonas sp. App30]|uniref:5'/3'-nucleotidase SurE n=1 Tax=Pseudomonas sp. App30 TaxID=3068990 RepID=UPI003A7FECCF
MDPYTPLFDRVLLTNDDGISAPGLAALEAIATKLAREVWVVAPAHDQSGVSHAISIHHPLRVETLGERRFAVQGTPGDCVVLALQHLMPHKPTLILSGVNRGANLGVETAFSGTVGAAMAGMLLGVPSIALSQAFTKGQPVKWATVEALGVDVLARVAQADWAAGSCLNINFPDVEPAACKGTQYTSQGTGRLNGIQVTGQQDPRNVEYFWLNMSRTESFDEEGTETHGVFNGYVTVTPLTFERTAQAVLDCLK